ncbi:hypothetical protein L1887_59187 [Cichorium endivia]|nr:hypothetical protein L1887_59187 [Cichorium endivia]
MKRWDAKPQSSRCLLHSRDTPAHIPDLACSSSSSNSSSGGGGGGGGGGRAQRLASSRRAVTNSHTAKEKPGAGERTGLQRLRSRTNLCGCCSEAAPARADARCGVRLPSGPAAAAAPLQARDDRAETPRCRIDPSIRPPVVTAFLSSPSVSLGPHSILPSRSTPVLSQRILYLANFRFSSRRFTLRWPSASIARPPLHPNSLDRCPPSRSARPRSFYKPDRRSFIIQYPTIASHFFLVDPPSPSHPGIPLVSHLARPPLPSCPLPAAPRFARRERSPSLARAPSVSILRTQSWRYAARQLTESTPPACSCAHTGKSSLIVRYVEDAFVDSYYPTIENIFQKTITHKGQEYDCDIIDTAGQDEYSILNSKHAIGIHGYMLVYSIASRNSFDMVQTVHDKILNYTGTESVPCVIVGQKSDLHVQRQVSEAEGKQLASQLKAAWIEVSARHNANVAKAFEAMLGETEQGTQEGGPEPQPSKCIVM